MVCFINIRIYLLKNFNLIEKKHIGSLVNNISKQINKKKPKFHIRKPLIQSILIKIYVLLFR